MPFVGDLLLRRMSSFALGVDGLSQVRDASSGVMLARIVELGLNRPDHSEMLCKRYGAMFCGGVRGASVEVRLVVG